MPYFDYYYKANANVKLYYLKYFIHLINIYAAFMMPKIRLLRKFHVMGFCRNYLPTGFREDFPSVRLCGLKERKVTATVLR